LHSLSLKMADIINSETPKITNMQKLQRLGTGQNFITSKAKAVWFFRENGQYHAYDETIYGELSDRIENAFQRTQGIGLIREMAITCTINNVTATKLFEIDFDEMTSTMQGASKMKHITRGVWFFQRGDGSWYPYDMEVAALLENAVVTIKSAPPPKPTFKVNVDDARFVVAVGPELTQFRQYRTKGKPEGRAVQRGYKGIVLQN